MADQDPSLWAQVLGRVAYEFAQVQPMLPTHIHLILSALFPIYIGAHASLSRPSSAAKPVKKKGRSKVDDDDDDTDEEDDDEDEDEEEERVMEGLSPTDAILMPLFAGAALTSLYFLLKWLKDPTMLNKILNAYFAVFGVFSVSRLVTDMLDTGHALIYPRRYARGGALYYVDGDKHLASPVAGNIKDKQPKASPLPGFLAALPLSDRFRNMLWADRAMPGNKWALKMRLHKAFSGKVKIGPHGFAGILAGLSAVAYFNLVDKPWYLTNLLGFGFSYGALQLMSPTTFTTGSLILSALFFYDIYFVFFTPMMVHVAKSLDVPIKLMFPRPGDPENAAAPPSHAMLGLGDVVLPGIVIGLALRFDLYLFYLRQQKRITSTTPGEPDTVEKPKYHSFVGKWSDHFWSHSFTGRPLWSTASQSEDETQVPFTFPKTYFKASLIGYVLGLLTTLGVMMIWNHAQPALLYLVPGVLGSLWLTALVRGELNLMWNYTEDIDQQTVDTDEQKKHADSKKDGADGNKPTHKSKTSISSVTSATLESDSETKKSARRKRVNKDREFFSFSIQAPWPLKKTTPDDTNSKGSVLQDQKRESKNKTHNWVPASPGKEAEPAGKRVRLK